ncbi:hypothetical protein EIP86_006519 [Pleurotus ostreatoroseus]|nr:hypothetical protein EIP86_006519 [Pleurotus ostreatoroseus]
MSGIDLSLKRITKLLSSVCTYTRPTCHIAGTNGKGSVSALLSSVLSAASYCVGRFNSPHLVSIYDCITIDSEPVSPSVYADVRRRVEAANAALELHSTNFELLACTALTVLEESRVDVAVVEVGMGGRLDATNALPDACVLVSALTAVDLDHTSFLGDTVALIAREKAGIARKGRPFVLGPQKYEDVERVARRVVEECGATFVKAIVPTSRAWDERIDGPYTPVTRFAPEDLQELPPQPVEAAVAPFPGFLRLLLPLQGEHQLANLGIALSMISSLLVHCSSSPLRFSDKLTMHAIQSGIRQTHWPGRLSLHCVPIPRALGAGIPQQEPPSGSCERKVLVLADGAHNPSSSATLSSYLTALFAASSRNMCAHPFSPPAPFATSTLPPPPRPRTVNLTFMLGLSRSPPKTPTQTLTPLLTLRPQCHTNVILRTRAALLRFTTPDGMPWIKSESPSELKRVVDSLLPEVAEVWAAEDDEPAEGQIADALNWAVQRADADARKGVTDDEHLIILAGSLFVQHSTST